MIKKMIKGIMAGVTISCGGIIFLSLTASGSKNLGAFLFTVGILLVMEFGFLLYTGYVPTKRDQMSFKDYMLSSLFVILCNLIGCLIMACLVRITRIYDTIAPTLNSVLDTKLNDNLLSIFVLSIFCGFIIAMIVMAKNYKQQVLYVAMLIMVFILAGFEHVVANGFYLFLGLFSKGFSLNMIWFLLVNLAGNFLGGFASSFIKKLNEEPKKEN